MIARTCDVRAMWRRAPIALLALAATPDAPAAEAIPRTIDLAEAELSGWSLRAWVDVDRIDYPDGELPMIAAVGCEMEQVDGSLWLRLYSDSGVGLSFRDGEFDTRQITAVRIGETVWEYREDPPDREFIDVEYPRPDPEPPRQARDAGARIMVDTQPEVKVAAPRVRRSAGEPWFPLPTLVNELFETRSLHLTYSTEDEPAETREVEVSLAGLDQAQAWCEQQLRSDAARRFRQN
jgi:hypothetical protein